MTARILVVDDIPANVKLLEARLQAEYFEVLSAHSGQEALELLSDDRLKVDLFVSDVVMPGLDGLSWVRLALKDRPGTRVIFMSGYTEDVFEDGRNPVEGASFLQKPFSLTDLISAVGDKLEHAA